jgi:epsilon-lactone hydrolase
MSKSRIARRRVHMPSNHSRAVSDLYRSWREIPAGREDWTVQDQTALIDGWNVLTAEPGGVDYAEVEVAGRAALWAIPHDAPEGRVIMCIHGGGFISGSIWTHRKLYAHVAKAVGARALIVSYPLVHEAQHPAPLHAVLAAYEWLLAREPDDVMVGGDSAGGGLALTLQLAARERGLPLPHASYLISPWVDMEVTASDPGTDALFDVPWVKQMAGAFLAGTDPRDPLANPLHADLAGLGPVYIQAGGAELLLNDAQLLAARLEQAGVPVCLDVVPDMQHTFQMMAGRAPEADAAIARVAAVAQSRYTSV